MSQADLKQSNLTQSAIDDDNIPAIDDDEQSNWNIVLRDSV